jgi:C-terminal processing protease CtpA/Prc
MLIAAAPNPKLLEKFNQIGFDSAQEEKEEEPSRDVSRLEFPSTTDLGLGIVIGGFADRYFISSILSDGDAALDGRLREGDELVFIGDEPVDSMPAGSCFVVVSMFDHTHV